MMRHTVFERVRTRLRQLRDDARGVSAVEFALVLPILMLLFFGGVEVSEGLTIKRKVTQVTSTLADLITQSRKVSDSDMKNILDASESVMTPYPSDLLKIVVSGITIDKDGKATVDWSDARNASALSKGTEVSLPKNLDQKNTFLVTAAISYDYTPTIGYVMSGTFTMDDGFYLRPRVSDTVERTK